MRMRCLRDLMGVALVGLAACSGSDRAAKDPGDSTPKAAAQSYAEALLHGSSADYIALWSKTCDKPKAITEAAWTDEQKAMGTSLGTPVSGIEVTGAKVRDQTASTASATATYDLDEAAAGNENWIPFLKENGHWRVSNCTLLPIGGSSTGAKSN